MKAASLLLVALLAGCASAGRLGLKDFTTDGCSLFPDGVPWGKDTAARERWCDCCLVHDFAYWRGGTEAERLAADRALRECVHARTQDRDLASLMYRGVRAGGGPAFPTWYRWGYGWDYGRGYQPLTAEETAEAGRRLARWQRERPSGGCANADERTDKVVPAGGK